MSSLDLELEIAKARRAREQEQSAAPAAQPSASAPPAIDFGVGGSGGLTPAAAINPNQAAAMGAGPPSAAPDWWGHENDPLWMLRHAAHSDAQAGLRGAADVVGSPVDLPIAATKLAGWGYNELAAKPYGLPEFPNINFSLADTIANASSWLATQLGAPPLTEHDMTPSEQSMQHPIEFGTGALIGGAGLASRAPAVADKIATTVAKPSVIDRLSTPYINRPTAALGRDFGTGAGAGVGLDVAHDVGQSLAPDNPVAQRTADVLGMILGSIGGHGAMAGVNGISNVATGIPRKVGPWSTDTNVPVNPMSGQPYSKAQTDLAARVWQGDASDPAAAKANITQNSADLTAAGVPQNAQPTTGLLSGDQGLVNLETSFRTRQPADFIERDQAVKGEAADRVGSLTNPTADQRAVGPGIEGAVKDIKTERDMEALPLLMQAEGSGVVANPQSVVDLIDNQLAIVKRPTVRRALQDARAALYTVKQNAKDPDVLDTSVSGLYEARKTINDQIAGRGTNSSDQFAVKELSAVRDALDKAITDVSPEFGEYLSKFREGSQPLDAVKTNTAAQQLINGEDARNVAQGLFGGYGGENKAREIADLVANDPKAAAGWKAAVAEVLVNRVTGTKAVGESYEASFARLANEFKKNEDILRNVFTPEEMNTLQQAHTLLGYFKAGENRATTGSQTAERLLRTSDAERLMGGPLGRGFELVVKHIYGNLQGGGMVRRFRLMVGLLPTSRDAAGEVAKMAFFNPEVAAYLLGKPVRNLSAIPANNGLRNAIAADAASSEDNKDNGSK